MCGRPSKLTIEAQKKIAEAIRLGATYQAASAAGGISYASFNNWMNKGADAKSGQYFEFFNAIKKAESDAQLNWLEIIEKAAPRNWQAAAWKLERRYPDDFGRQKMQLEHSGKDGSALEIIVTYADGKRNSNDTEAA